MLSRIKETVFHGVIYGFGQTLSSAVGFLLIPLYTQYLTPSDYGIIALLHISMTLVIAIFGLGLSAAIFRSYYDYDGAEERKVVVSTTFFTLLASVCLLALFTFSGASFFSRLIFGKIGYEKYITFSFLSAGLLSLNRSMLKSASSALI